MPQRYREEVEALAKALLNSHEKDGLIYSGIATLLMVALTIYWVDGLIRLRLIGG
ncbi:hypothetical protein [Acaryochloris marina]|uniref:hypothetical protein n=1 Tax=Acaryochloris marina TaxID=155978 RepID=UPI001BAFDA09|nr:hypothetical protein [Acaryochloris marina]QUY41577.1 hypothetical protein I1H34_20365 [Acaryochloris marina S15]